MFIKLGNADTDRLLPRDRSVLWRDVHLLLPEEQLQELPDVLQEGPALPHLLLPRAGWMNDDGRRPASNPVVLYIAWMDGVML